MAVKKFRLTIFVDFRIMCGGTRRGDESRASAKPAQEPEVTASKASAAAAMVRIMMGLVSQNCVVLKSPPGVGFIPPGRFYMLWFLHVARDSRKSDKRILCQFFQSVRKVLLRVALEIPGGRCRFPELRMGPPGALGSQYFGVDFTITSPSQPRAFSNTLYDER